MVETWKAGCAALALMSLCGCGTGPNQLGGAAAGGALGGLAGSMLGGGSGRIVGTAAGATLGAIAGAALGGQFDQPPAGRGPVDRGFTDRGVPTPGEEAAHARGRADFLRERQVLLEEEAYRRGRAGSPLR